MKCEVFFIDSIDSASCGKGPMPLSHFRIQASKAHINKPPKTSVWRVCPRREIPPALLPLLILPLLVYVALSLSSPPSLSSKLPPIGILKFNSGAKAEATGWGYGRGRADVLRLLLLFLLGPKPMAAQSLHSAVLSPPSFTCERNLSGPRASGEWMRQRGNYSSPAPSPSLPSAPQSIGPATDETYNARPPPAPARPSVRCPPLWPQESSVHCRGPFLAFNYDIV